jgi:hypothetical protein
VPDDAYKATILGIPAVEVDPSRDTSPSGASAPSGVPTMAQQAVPRSFYRR